MSIISKEKSLRLKKRGEDNNKGKFYQSGRDLSRLWKSSTNTLIQIKAIKTI
jgi:hypothetical protein